MASRHLSVTDLFVPRPRMLENGADMRQVQSMLGHDCIASTQAYTELSIRQLKKVHAMTHPAAGNVLDEVNE
jgi:site-specific recombinase XerC